MKTRSGRQRSAWSWQIGVVLLTACLSPVEPAAAVPPDGLSPAPIQRRAVRWVATHSGSAGGGRGVVQRLSRLVLGYQRHRLVRPLGVAWLKDRIWVADPGLRALMEIDPDRGHFAPRTKAGDRHLFSPVGLCRRGLQILFTDSKLGRVFVVGRKNRVRELNDTLRLERPTGIAYAAGSRRIWVAETGRHRLVVLDEEGNPVATVGRHGAGRGEFNFPTFLWADDEDRIYVVDTLNFRIVILDPAGEVLGMFGQAGDATGFLARPKGIAVDGQGNIYVTDALFHTVQVFDRQGRFLLNFGTQGRGDGQFWLPAGIDIDGDDRIYVADSYNSRVQVFELLDLDEDED